jgi:hypothetical protein
VDGHLSSQQRIIGDVPEQTLPHVFPAGGQARVPMITNTRFLSALGTNGRGRVTSRQRAHLGAAAYISDKELMTATAARHI